MAVCVLQAVLEFSLITRTSFNICMVVPLGHILAQQPLIASLRTVLEPLTGLEGQFAILEAQKQILDSRYKDDLLRQYISLLERKGEEVMEEIWEVFYQLKSELTVQKGEKLCRSEGSVRYDLPQDQYVIVEENRSILVSSGQTGHRTWESSLAFTDFVCQNQTQFKDTDCFIELGCGTGLVSMAMGKLSLARRILATDGSELVVSRLRKAIAQNDLVAKVQTDVLDWTDLDSVAKLPKSASIFAGDILYGLSSIYPTLLNALRLLKAEKVLLCVPIRKASSHEYFKQVCADKNVGVKVLKRYEAKSADETDHMFLISIPPIPLEIMELVF